MNVEKRIIAFAALGKILKGIGEKGQGTDQLSVAIDNARKHNRWFTEDTILLAMNSLGEMLEEGKLRKWMDTYPEAQSQKAKKGSVGVVMAGNVPLVGFHDFLCVLMCGRAFVGKLSSDDKFLLPAVAEILIQIEPAFKPLILFTDQPFNKPTNISAFIATGSNNSARYFEYYFSKYPHIIRKNRNAVAVLDGTESEADLKNLGKDIFQYFGLGCRNVSKIFIPQDYNLDKLFSALVDFGDIIHHNKYANNYNYYRTIYLLNTEKFLDNNFLLVKECEQIASPVATLYYERYERKVELIKRIEENRESIQCIIASPLAPLQRERGMSCIEFGKSQSPELWDYADGVDTMKFLMNL